MGGTVGKNNDETFMMAPNEWFHENWLHDHEGEKSKHEDATVKSDVEAVGNWMQDPDNIGMLLDPVVVVGAGYRCSQFAIDWAEGHTDQEALHAGECTADEIMSLVSIASGGTALPEAEAAMEEENASLTTAKAVAKETTSNKQKAAKVWQGAKELGKDIKIMGPGGMVVVAATPAVIKVVTARQKAEEAKQKAEEKKRDIDLWNDYLNADIYKQAFDEQGVWDADFRPKLVPATVQPAQEEDEPVLAHEVVEPTVEPDLQPSVSAPSAPPPANLQTTGAVLVLTGVMVYAAYSTYVSA